ncbi:Dabb family protein [Microbacterium sp. LX3-4]|uniref:Dabb family protein n=1 Tax=Microbacterium dauci TaxID=3048008 RepID=A0ABT6ZFE9_9MICO|nr:Dabb family protein [Microbacterium sp. LX3-4]MDJ1114450.1 Dabb family protein [Microbacterium sp. LX3-4]
MLFRVYDAVSEEDVDSAIASLRALESLPSVLSWRVERSSDTRKGRVIVEDASFASEADFAAFRSEPAHIAVGNTMSRVSDWLTGDYGA